MSSRSHLLLVLSLILRFRQVQSQSTNATCQNNSTTSWMFNAQGESPCMVWSKLQSLCLPSSRYVNIPPLQDSSFAYNAPGSQGTLCQCNVVAYGLMAGCSYCQLGASASYVSEEDWRSACPEYNNTSISFAQTSLTLPAFAFTPWNGQSWSPDAARLPGTVTAVPTIASTTFSRAFSTRSLTSAPSSSSISPLPTPSSSSNSAEEGGGKSKLQKYGPIIGGVAGGLVLLIILLLLLRWYRTRPSSSPTTSKGLLAPSPPTSFLPTTRDPPARKDAPKGISFLNLFPLSSYRNSRASKSRNTWDTVDAFSHPRPEPDPRTYTTTQQRLRTQPYASSSSGASSSDSEKREKSDIDSIITGGLPDLSHLPAPPDTGRSTRWNRLDVEAGPTPRPIVEDDGSWRSHPSPPETAKATYQPILPSQRQALTRNMARRDVPPASIDFSAAPSPEPGQVDGDGDRGVSTVAALSPGPMHQPPNSRDTIARARLEDDDGRSVLPSLYEPPTGASPFQGDTGRDSPESRYPATERHYSVDQVVERAAGRR